MSYLDVRMPARRLCKSCNGYGRFVTTPPKPVTWPPDDADVAVKFIEVVCPDCNGSGLAQ